MGRDDLDAPLGLPPVKGDGGDPLPRDMPWTALAIGGIGLIAASLFAFVIVTEDRISSPQALATVDPGISRKIAAPDLAPSQNASVARDEESTSTIARTRASIREVDVENGVKVVRRGGSDAPEALIIRVPQDDLKTSLAPAPDPRLVVQGPHGPLPRIGRDGARPADVYARPVVLGTRLPPHAPRIAIVVTGMGASDSATERAISDLPPAVTLAFAPYGARLAVQTEQARSDGHELLLQVPMEGFNTGDGGPRLLSTHAPREKVLDQLHWHMSRFPGYVGLTHYLGGRFMSAQPAIGAVLQDLAERGLIFLDDGSSPQSIAGAAASATGASLARADLVLDAQPKAESIDAALRKLETLARERGSAIGVASAFPTSVDRVSRFAQGLEARGLALVPLSSLVNAPARTSQR